MLDDMECQERHLHCDVRESAGEGAGDNQAEGALSQVGAVERGRLALGEELPTAKAEGQEVAASVETE